MGFEEGAELIESSLAELGLNPVDTRGSEAGQWIIYNGDTEIYLDLWQVERDNSWLYFETDEKVYAFQVISPVCYLPETGQEQLFEELLHNNLNMFWSSYTINREQNMLAIRYRRPLKGIGREEIIEAIESVGYYSESTFSALEQRYKIGRIEPENAGQK